MTLLSCTILGLLVEAIFFTLLFCLCLGLYETADLEVEATPRQDGLGGGLGGSLGGRPSLNSRLPPLLGWPSAWTLVGSEYYLRHLRTSACGTRARTSPCSSGHFAFFEDSLKAQAEELPTFIFGGSPKPSRQVDLSKVQAEEFPTFIFGGGPNQEDTPQFQYTSFCQRTKRMLVKEIGDGNCGVRGLWRQFDKSIGEASTSINSEHIRSGRVLLASALRTNSSSIIKVIEQRYGIDGNEVSSEVSQT